jgi:hypothetical protein
MRRGAPTVRLGAPKFERTDRFHANETPCAGHGQFDPELPESAAAYSVIVRFFDKHLGS